MSPRVYVITGTSRGLGLEFVKQLSAQPNTLIFAIARKLASAKDLKALQGPNVVLVEADTAEQTDIDAAVSAVKAKTDHVDVLINNAGVLLGPTLPNNIKPSEQSPDDFLETFRINVVGIIRVTNAFLPLLKAGTEKKIIQLSSTLGSIKPIVPKTTPKEGSFGFMASAYATSKAALNMVNAKYAAEFDGQGFTFYAMHPGWVQTDMGGSSAWIQADYSIKEMRRIIDGLTPENDNGGYGGVDVRDLDF